MMKSLLLDSLQAAKSGEVPLVDFHMHTTWTDGHNDACAMHDAAIRCGLVTILFSEHARRTSEDWFFDFAAQIRSLPSDGCRALVGVEAKVLEFDGAIDTTDKIAETCDLVMASVHRFPDGKGDMLPFDDVDPEQATDIEMRLMLAAMDNPTMDILGHPFGVSHTRFQATPTEDQYRKVIEKAAASGAAFEVNSQYHSDPWQLIAWCREAGATISLGSNAHRDSEVGDIVRALRGNSVPAWSIDTARRSKEYS